MSLRLKSLDVGFHVDVLVVHAKMLPVETLEVVVSSVEV